MIIWLLVGALCLALLWGLREAFLDYPSSQIDAQALSRKEEAILRASADAFLPEGGDLPSAEKVGVVGYVDGVLTELPFRQRFLIRLLLVFVEHGSLIFGPNRNRLTRQTRDERVKTFEAWEQSTIYFRRLSFLSLRTLVTLAYFSDPSVILTLNPPRT